MFRLRSRIVSVLPPQQVRRVSPSDLPAPITKTLGKQAFRRLRCIGTSALGLASVDDPPLLSSSHT